MSISGVSWPITRDPSLITHGSSLMAHHSWLITHGSSLMAHHSSLMTSNHHDSWLPSRLLAPPHDSWLPSWLLVPLLTPGSLLDSWLPSWLLAIVFLIVIYGELCSFIFYYLEKPRGNSDRPFFIFWQKTWGTPDRPFFTFWQKTSRNFDPPFYISLNKTKLFTMNNSCLLILKTSSRSAWIKTLHWNFDHVFCYLYFEFWITVFNLFQTKKRCNKTI